MMDDKSFKKVDYIEFATIYLTYNKNIIYSTNS